MCHIKFITYFYISQSKLKSKSNISPRILPIVLKVCLTLLNRGILYMIFRQYTKLSNLIMINLLLSLFLLFLQFVVCMIYIHKLYILSMILILLYMSFSNSPVYFIGNKQCNRTTALSLETTILSLNLATYCFSPYFFKLCSNLNASIIASIITVLFGDNDIIYISRVECFNHLSR